MSAWWYVRRPLLARLATAAVGVVGVLLLAWAGWMEHGTDRSAHAEQERLRQSWAYAEVDAPPTSSRAGDTAPAVPDTGPGAGEGDDGMTGSGAPVATLDFYRADGTKALSEPQLVVVSGVASDQLSAGVGHYPMSSLPGTHGNFAVAGHRTTHGGPFEDLDTLHPGDRVLVGDASGWTWAYEVTGARIVTPNDTSVLIDDPLGARGGVITLTTCHPKGSAKQRLVVFGTVLDYRPTARASELIPVDTPS